MSNYTLKQNANVVLINKTAFASTEVSTLSVIDGARLVLALKVLAIDVGATVTVTVKNSFNSDNLETLETFAATTVSNTKKIYTDFFQVFEITAVVSGGAATFQVASAVFDNALPATFENAEINVALTHQSDSVKIGDGTDVLGVNPDGSINVQVTDVTAAIEAESLAITTALGTTNASLASIDGKDFATETTLGSLLSELEQKADLIDTQPVSVASLPLPTGASTETTLSSLLTELQGKADLIETQPVSGPLTDAELRATAVPVSGTFWQATQPVSGTFWQSTQPISAVSLPLPTGASTEAKQDTGNGYLGTISTNLTDLVSVVNSTITPLAGGATFTGVAEEITQYSGVCVNVAVDQSGTLHTEFSSNGTDWDDAESDVLTIDSPGTVEAFFYQKIPEAKYYRIRYVNGGTIQGAFRLQVILKQTPVLSRVELIGTPVTALTDALATKGVIYGVTTAGGGGYVAVKVNPSGALTAAVTGTFWQDTQPVSVASLPLPTGASTEATLSALNAKVTAVNTGAVVVASSALPTGASTEAKQDTAITSLGAIDDGITALQTVNASSTPAISQPSVTDATSVIIASNDPNRKGFIIANDSAYPAFVAFAATASLTLYSVKIAPGGIYSMDSGFIYRGAVSAIANTGITLSLQITEFD